MIELQISTFTWTNHNIFGCVWSTHILYDINDEIEA